jgi:hypothetical protein
LCNECDSTILSCGLCKKSVNCSELRQRNFTQCSSIRPHPTFITCSACLSSTKVPEPRICDAMEGCDRKTCCPYGTMCFSHAVRGRCSVCKQEYPRGYCWSWSSCSREDHIDRRICNYCDLAKKRPTIGPCEQRGCTQLRSCFQCIFCPTHGERKECIYCDRYRWVGDLEPAHPATVPPPLEGAPHDPFGNRRKCNMMKCRVPCVPPETMEQQTCGAQHVCPNPQHGVVHSCSTTCSICNPELEGKTQACERHFCAFICCTRHPAARGDNAQTACCSHLLALEDGASDVEDCPTPRGHTTTKKTKEVVMNLLPARLRRLFFPKEEEEERATKRSRNDS